MAFKLFKCSACEERKLKQSQLTTGPTPLIGLTGGWHIANDEHIPKDWLRPSAPRKSFIYLCDQCART